MHGDLIKHAIQREEAHRAMGAKSTIDKPEIPTGRLGLAGLALAMGAVGLAVTAFGDVDAGNEPSEKPAPTVVFHQNHPQ